MRLQSPCAYVCGSMHVASKAFVGDVTKTKTHPMKSPLPCSCKPFGGSERLISLVDFLDTHSGYLEFWEW